MIPEDGQAPAPRFGMLRTIALYKLVKVLLLLAVAYGEVRLSDASLTVTCAFIALPTRGRITPLKKAPLVATKYTTTSSTIRIPKTQAIARSQPRRFLGAGVLTVVSVIKAPSEVR